MRNLLQRSRAGGRLCGKGRLWSYLCSEDLEGEVQWFSNTQEGCSCRSGLSTPSSMWWQLLAASCLTNTGSTETTACTARAVSKVVEIQEAGRCQVCQWESGLWGTHSSRNDFHHQPTPWGHPVWGAPVTVNAAVGLFTGLTFPDLEISDPRLFFGG